MRRGRFLKRLNRFTALVDFGNGEVERSHLNNTGRLEDLLREGVPVLCTPTRGKRLRTRISAVEVEENSYALIDTHIQENIVALAINGGRGVGEEAEGCVAFHNRHNHTQHARRPGRRCGVRIGPLQGGR